MTIFTCRKCQYNCTIKCNHYKCGGAVVEADYVLNRKHKTTDLNCINCGKYYEVNTDKYLHLLDLLKIDYSRRVV